MSSILFFLKHPSAEFPASPYLSGNYRAENEFQKVAAEYYGSGTGGGTEGAGCLSYSNEQDERMFKDIDVRCVENGTTIMEFSLTATMLRDVYNRVENPHIAIDRSSFEDAYQLTVRSEHGVYQISIRVRELHRFPGCPREIAGFHYKKM